MKILHTVDFAYIGVVLNFGEDLTVGLRIEVEPVKIWQEPVVNRWDDRSEPNRTGLDRERPRRLGVVSGVTGSG